MPSQELFEKRLPFCVNGPGKMHRSPYLYICIYNPSTDLDSSVISAIKGLNGTLKDCQQDAMHAFVNWKLHTVEIVGTVSDHLKAQVSALAK
jgi:hypothetical protein